ncbi:hypothetical protein PAPHI01_1966 [Pancytospora philotis]|nr:hypothetical protein PAPHI01_1966 [Pancytospora philotis]
MRCAIMLNSITCCLAAHMWHRVGLLTDDDYAQVANKIVAPPSSDSRRRYMPGCFLGFAYEMQWLARPNYDAEPLKVEGAGVSDTAAYSYRTEWRDLLCKKYKDLLRVYVDTVYHQGSFEKRLEESTVKIVIDALIGGMKQSLSSSEQLRKSYAYIRSLTRAFDFNYAEFRRMIVAFGTLTEKLSAFVNNFQVTDLESLDDAAIKKLDKLRESLDDNCLNHTCGKYFNDSIPTPMLASARIPEAIDDDLIDRLDKYCKKMLACAHGFPEDISRHIFGFLMRYNGEKDPHEHLHLVYPEMDYEAWRHYWQAAQKQVTVELEALQRHVDEVQRCRSEQQLEPYVKYLVESMDSVLESHRITNSDQTLGSEKIVGMVDDAITAVAKDISSLSFEDIDELIANEAEAAVDDEDVLGSADSVRCEFELINIAGTVANDTPVPSPESIHKNINVNNAPASAAGSPQHSRAYGAAWSQSKTERLERVRKTIAKPKVKHNRRHLHGQTEGGKTNASESPERMED